MTKVVIVGACGHMGRVIADIIKGRDDCTVIAGIDKVGGGAAFPIFRDFSDPEAEEPTDRTLNDFLKMVSEEVSFNEDNTEITFDENGHLAVLLYKYTPWN